MISIFENLRRLWIRKSLFLLFLKSYIPIIAIMLVFSMFSYFVAIWQINDNVKKLNLSLMNNISSVIDQRLAEIERTSHRLNSLGTTMKLAYMEESNKDFYYEMTRYVQNLWTLWLENDSLTPRMYIYFARSGILAAPDTFYKTEDFYNRFFTYDNMAADEFFSMLTEEENNFRYLPARPISLKDQADLQGTFDMVIYNYQMKQISDTTAPGSIFFLIDIREITKMMEVLEIGDGGLAVIMNREGKIVAKLDNRSGVDDNQILEIASGNTEILEDQMVITCLSDQNGWKYLALGTRDVLMKPVMVLRQVLALLFMLSVLLASALSLWMARKRSLPLFDLVCRLNAGQYPEAEKLEEAGTGYQSLETGISSMLLKNVHMQEQLETIHPMLLPAFLHRLFGGGFADDREVSDAAGQIGIIMPLPPYRLISFIVAPPSDRIPDLHEGVLQTLIMQTAVRDCLDQMAIKDGLVYQMKMDEILWIYSGSENPSDEAEMLTLLDRIVGWMGERQFKVSIRFSPYFDTLADCWWEYERINHTLSDISHSDTQRSNVELVWHDPDPDQRQYMLLVEPILSSMYRAGDERMLGRLLDIVKKEIFETLQMDPASIRTLIRQLRDAASKLTGIPLDQPSLSDIGLEPAFDAVREAILDTCHDSVLSRNESGSFLIRKIREFTDQQLYNPLLSMTMIADKMNISENYLSRIFKDQYGDTLANYIEKSRIQSSQELLLSTMMSVSDIALKVGYNSDHVFRRAFRRVTGMSPVEFRQGTNSAPGD